VQIGALDKKKAFFADETIFLQKNILNAV